MLEQYNKVWFSRDMDGWMDLWKIRPVYHKIAESFFWRDSLSEMITNTSRLKHLTKQLGTPKPGELWEIELYD